MEARPSGQVQKDHRYYELIDETLANDFEYRYALLEDSSENVGAIQPIFFFFRPAKSGRRHVRRVPAELSILFERHFHDFSMRVLMVGCAAGAGELGSQ